MADTLESRLSHIAKQVKEAGENLYEEGCLKNSERCAYNLGVIYSDLINLIEKLTKERK